MFRTFLDKLKEASMGVIPVTLIIIIVNFVTTPMGTLDLASFLVGAFFLITGLTLYNFGSGASIEFMGGLIGAEVTKTKKLPLILAICGAIGVIVTIAEPDLTVLANQVQGIDNWILIGAVAAGVGAFMLVAVLRLVFKIDLKWVLLFFYGIIFVLAFVIDKKFVPLAFDSSGVTTGPVTVPFIMALGAALSATLGGRDSQDSSFGIVGICSIGPILAIIILSLFSKNMGVGDSVEEVTVYTSFGGVMLAYLKAFPHYLKEMAIALAPILVFFIIYDIAAFKLSFKKLMRTFFGALYVYLGLSLFLMGANMGFLPAGTHIGVSLANTSKALLILVGVVVGAVIVLAEPAVHVLTRQVEEVTNGVIKKKVMLVVMCISMAISVGLAMMRIVFDISIIWVLVIGFGVALGLMFVVPKIFTGIAFDSGGVASGAMTAAFLLPMATGATNAIYGNDPTYLMLNAFGVVAMVAMTPLVAIQILGLIYKIHTVKEARERSEEFAALLAHEGEVVVLGEDTPTPAKKKRTRRRGAIRRQIEKRRTKKNADN